MTKLQTRRQSIERSVWLVRHGSRLDMADPNWSTTAARPEDTPLAPVGFVQARETGQRLAREPIAHLLSSPFRRTMETAATIAPLLGQRIKVEYGMSEWLNPDWFPAPPRLLSLQELAAEFSNLDLAYRSCGRAVYPESEQQKFDRTAGMIHELLDTLSGDLLLVGHGASVIGVTTALLGRRPDVLFTGYCSIIQLQPNGNGRWQLTRDGSDTSHLSSPEK